MKKHAGNIPHRPRRRCRTQVKTKANGRVKNSMQLLRSSLVSRHGKPRGESWKARAREREETVQARTVGIIDSERMGGGRQGTDLLAALGRARPLVFEERELSRYL